MRVHCQRIGTRVGQLPNQLRPRNIQVSRSDSRCLRKIVGPGVSCSVAFLRDRTSRSVRHNSSVQTVVFWLTPHVSGLYEISMVVLVSTILPLLTHRLKGEVAGEGTARLRAAQGAIALAESATFG